MLGPVKHLYFQSQPIWHHALEPALVAAKASGKRVLLTVGRIDCGGSRALVEKTISKEEIFDYLVEHFECVCRDADALDDRERELVARMRKAERTPFNLFVDADGKLLLETSGGRPAAVFLNDLVEAATKKPL